MKEELCKLFENIEISDNSNDLSVLNNSNHEFHFNKKLSKKQMKVLEEFSPNKYGQSEWITITPDFRSKFNFGKNGNGRHQKYLNCKFCNWEKYPISGEIERLRMIGWDENFKNKSSRQVREDIELFYRQKSCVVCGSTSGVIVDHKNDLYNDDRVLSLKTQTFEDFQTLCQHCNLQKRQVMKKTLETGKRYGATNIPILKHFGIDFTIGDFTLDINDPNATVGTFWHDPVDFLKRVSKI
jgi:hypothetical protein